MESESENYSELLDSIRNEMDFSKLPLLVTGGAGYIGSHTVIELVKAGFTNIVVVDSFFNSSPKAIARVKQILDDELKYNNKKNKDCEYESKENTNTNTNTNSNSNETCNKYNLVTYEIDLAEDIDELHTICNKHRFFACLHFAGLKAVGESVAKPLQYYHNNLNSTINLLKVLPLYDCHNFLFSSSATVYGTETSPVSERSDVGRGISNPYGYTKYFVEQILHDTALANPDMNAVILRYFNPIGAHPSGLIGNDPNVPNNLMPYLLQVAVGRRPHLNVFGNDYDTHDGTGVRDYIHIVDIARGHVKALEMDIIPKFLTKEKLKKAEKEYENNINNNNEKKFKNGHTLSRKNKNNKNKNNTKNNKNTTKLSMKNIVSAYNLGTGKGTSVLELLHALEKACGKKIPYKIMGRRPGDLGTISADCTLARKKLGWKTQFTMEEACRDAWRWQSNNPMGFRSNENENENDGSKIQNTNNNIQMTNNINQENKSSWILTISSFFFMLVAIAAYVVMFQSSVL